MVPGSTLIYGSSLSMVTLRPRASRIAPREAEVIPLPSEETTPPVMKIYRVINAPSRVLDGVTDYQNPPLSTNQNLPRCVICGRLVLPSVQLFQLSSYLACLSEHNCPAC